MAIVRMKRLSVIGLDSSRRELMEELMRLGVVELTPQDAKLSDEEWSQLVSQDGNEEAVSKLDGELSAAAQALETLEKYGTGKKPLFKTRKPITRREFDEVLEKRKEIRSAVDQVLDLNRRLIESKTAENKAESLLLSLKPWESFDLPFEEERTKYTQVTLGVVPVSADLSALSAQLAEQVPECEYEVINSDAEQHYIYLLCLKEVREAVLDVLRQFSFSPVRFQEAGTAAEHIDACEQELARLKEQQEDLAAQIGALEYRRTEFEYLYDKLVMERDQQNIRNRLLVTDRAFYTEGWVPRLAAQKVEALLAEKGCWYEFRDPEKDEETPVLLQNGSFSTPFEAITKLYALPDSRSIDATPFFSFFYAVFFGMMLSDAAYGVILAVACFVILKKFRLEGMQYRMIKMLGFCGISTIFWGVMFGGYFGDVVTVVGKTFFDVDVAIPPLWFNPLDDVIKLLGFSLVLGILHLFVGMGLSGYLSIRDGRPFDAFCDVGLWYLIITGLAMFTPSILGSGTPVMTRIGLTMAGIGAIGVVIFGGRHKKGIGKIFGGVMSLYDVTSYLSDILSYSRLLALGLATGVIAQVINTMGTLAGGGIIGGILFVAVFLVGNTYNMAINSLGSFVHSSRLQYVEFFGKFYESGGEEFEPFDQNTKYVEITREDQ